MRLLIVIALIPLGLAFAPASTAEDLPLLVGTVGPGFTIDLQQKDVRLVLAAADQLGVPLPATSLIFQLYRTLQAQGLGAEGNHALVKALEHLAGFEVGGKGDLTPPRGSP